LKARLYAEVSDREDHVMGSNSLTSFPLAAINSRSELDRL